MSVIKPAPRLPNGYKPPTRLWKPTYENEDGKTMFYSTERSKKSKVKSTCII